jgi:transposase-like protein
MEQALSPPTSLLEAIRYFSHPDRCLAFMVAMRWPDGPVCPTCGSREVRFLSTRRLWECKAKHARKQFSVKVGTIMEDSPIGLDKWLPAIWIITSAKNGVSSHEMARTLGITQKSAWFLLHRIRLAMQMGSFERLSGDVEIDETFIGGRARNMHTGKRKVKGTGPIGKAAVMGLLERHGDGASKVHVSVVPSRRKPTLHAEVQKHVEPGTTVYTDALASYEGMDDYTHKVVDHAECYVKDKVIHTNGLENFWSLLKRSIRGTYINVQPFHLFRYLDEQSYRFNNRKDTDAGRFVAAVAAVAGRRLTYAQLIGN